MVRRHELTDQAWAQIAPLLPPTGRPGGQWADHRRVVNGISVEVGHRGALAGPARALWTLADLL